MLSKNLLAIVLRELIFISDFFKVSRGINGKNFPLRASDFQRKSVSRFSILLDPENKGGMTTKEVLRIMKAKGKKPARLLHVLSWWLRLSPAKRNDVPGLAILSATKDRKVVVISGRFDKRWLTLNKIPKKWGIMESSTAAMCDFAVIDR